ncbi:alpha/beta hydrolase [Neobacillus niacini]|uniref:alpha/beta hydrolase n=1 Tax=Neobacillus niacini TaxID=86668 RepID=UPI002FFE3E5A
MSLAGSVFTRKTIEFNAEGTMLRGWLYIPSSHDAKLPVIVMAHGYGSLKEMHLDTFAEKFAENGFAVLVYDNRNFGDSDGYPRQEINPQDQIFDYQHAITYVSSLQFIDNSRIGIWGSSYSGGHVIVVGAIDKRVKCVVSQVPTISGSQAALRRLPAEKIEKLLESFYLDRQNRMNGLEPVRKKLVPEHENDTGIYSNPDAVQWYLEAGKRSPNWVNEVTIRSIEHSRHYEPGQFISMLSPTPLLMLVAKNDTITPTDLALAAYEDAYEPKDLKIFEGHHFSPYVEKFEEYSEAALDWFIKHLKNNEKVKV